MHIKCPFQTLSVCSLNILIIALCTGFVRGQDRRHAPKPDAYPVTENFQGKPAPVLLNDKRARRYRTVLREGAKSGPNFAGHYTIVTWGCGLGNFSLAAIDAKTGEVLFPPFDCVELTSYGLPIADKGDNPAFRLESRLLVFYGSTDGKEKNLGLHFYVFKNSRFRKVYFVKETNR